MKTLKNIVIGLIFLPGFAYAGGFSLTDFKGDLEENIVKDAVYGQVPTQEIEGVLASMLKELYTEGLFTTNNEYTPCQRTALAQTEVVLSDMTHKRVLVGMLDAAYTAIKHISSGGTTILSGFLEEQARSKITSYVTDLIKTEKPEVVEFSHPGDCGMSGTAVFDKKNMKVFFGVTGDCNCRKVTPRKYDITDDYLRDFEVVLSADVYVKKADAKVVSSWVFWERIDVEIEYGIRNMQAEVTAACGCFIDEEDEDDESETEEDEEAESWWDGFVGWITDKFTKEEEDDTSEEDDDENEDTEDEDDVDEGNDAGTDFIGETPENQEQYISPSQNTESTQDETNTNSNATTESTQTQSFQCGSKVSVEGRSGVATFPYRPDSEGGVNFSCSNSCKTGQLCKVLPESVRAFGATCVYCSDLSYQPEEKKEAETKKDEPVKCSLPSQQAWNNTIIYGFKYTVLDEKRVRVENDRPYCGMNSLADFKKTTESMLHFFSCPSITTSEYVYSDIKSPCSFVAQFGD